MITLLVAAALAETDPCSAPIVEETAPAAGAVDVPLDAAIALVLGGSNTCGGRVDIGVVLEAIDPDVGRVEVLESTVGGVRGEVLWVTVDSGLAADTEYRLTLTQQTPDGIVSEIAFTTGPWTTEPLAGDPSVSSVTGSWIVRSNVASFEAVVRPVQNPWGSSVVALLDPDAADRVVAAAVLTEEGRALEHAWSAEDRPREESCFVAVQWDSAGRRVGNGEEVCARHERVGCATTPSRAASAALIAMALLLTRRQIWRRTPTTGSPSPRNRRS